MKIYISDLRFMMIDDVMLNWEKNGLEYVGGLRFKVIDKQLFFLSVIKYGLEYREVLE